MGGCQMPAPSRQNPNRSSHACRAQPGFAATRFLCCLVGLLQAVARFVKSSATILQVGGRDSSRRLRLSRSEKPHWPVPARRRCFDKRSEGPRRWVRPNAASGSSRKSRAHRRDIRPRPAASPPYRLRQIEVPGPEIRRIDPVVGDLDATASGPFAHLRKRGAGRRARITFSRPCLSVSLTRAGMEFLLKRKILVGFVGPNNRFASVLWPPPTKAPSQRVLARGYGVGCRRP